MNGTGIFSGLWQSFMRMCDGSQTGSNGSGPTAPAVATDSESDVLSLLTTEGARLRELVDNINAHPEQYAALAQVDETDTGPILARGKGDAWDG